MPVSCWKTGKDFRPPHSETTWNPPLAIHGILKGFENEALTLIKWAADLDVLKQFDKNDRVKFLKAGKPRSVY